jgi:transcriptional regulator with XRE-family HTH domain
MPRKGKKGPEPDDIIVGNNLKIYRVRAGMSQTDLGEKVNVTFQQIQKYEKGTNRISASKIVKIVRILKINYDQLFEGVTGGEIEPVAAPEVTMSATAVKLGFAFDSIPSPLVKGRLLSLVSAISNAEITEIAEEIEKQAA